MHLFYSTTISDSIIELDAEESRHLTKVLRLKPKDKVIVINGTGTKFEAEIIHANAKKSILVPLKKVYIKEEYLVRIASAPTKNMNRWEWFLEKTTEIGIDGIYPIKCANSERKIIKEERLQRILISAMKQSNKVKLPSLNELTPFQQFIDMEFEGEKFIAHCYDDIPREDLKKCYSKGKKALILIGPEGDFSREEVELAIKKGYQSIRLSNSRLRSETAAFVACHTIHVLNA